MDSRRWTVPALTLIAAAMACSAIPGLPVLTPTAPAAVEEASPPPSIPALTADQVLNAEFTITTFDGEAHIRRFTDGAYEQGSDPTAADYASIHMVAVQADQRVIFGDLNDDGAQDAAVILAENYGGTGVFVSVAAVINENGRPRHAASYAIDDRPAVNAYSIQDGDIFLDAVVHGPNDPGCCPQMAVTRTFRLTGNQLMLVGGTSRTPAGLERAITIDGPLDGTEIRGALQLTGGITISPFENTLSYSFYSSDGSELARGPFMVNTPELGGPSTFDTLLDLAGLPAGPVILIVAEFSAADGSVLALDSVELVAR